MCYRILEQYYGGNSESAASLRDNLIAVYAIGWDMTEEMVAKYPQIVPAKGETDTGCSSGELELLRNKYLKEC